MHKAVIIHIILLIGIKCCQTEQQLVKKCHAFAGDDSNTNLEEALPLFKNCYLQNLENFRHTVSGGNCHNTTLKIKACGNAIVNKIEECNSSDQHYFPKVVFATIGDYAAHICSNSPDYKFPVLLEHKTCFTSLWYGMGCFEKFRFFNSTVNVSEEDMCSDEKSVMECLLAYVNSTCKADEVFPQLVINAFNFSQPPCTTGSSVVLRFSGILLFISIVLTATKHIN